MDVSPDGKTIVTGEYGPEVKLWDVATATAIRNWHAADGNHVAFSPDGSMVISASYRDGSIRVWKPDQDEPLHLLKDNPDGVEIALRPGTTILASASIDGVRFWDVAAGRLVDKWDVENANAIAFSRDGRMLAVSSLNTITVWDADASPSADDLIAEFNKQVKAIEIDAAANIKRRRQDLLTALEKLRDTNVASKKFDDALAIHARIQELQTEQDNQDSEDDE